MAGPTVADIMDSLAHPKIVEAFLLSPVFLSKMPKGTQIFLRGNYPVPARDGVNPTAIAGEKFTWAIVDETDVRKPVISSAAVVDLSLTDADMDALDVATVVGGLSGGVQDGKVVFHLPGDKVVKPDEPEYKVFNFALEGSALAHAAGTRIVLSNGPRSLHVDITAAGPRLSPSFGARADGTAVGESRATTTLYGALVSDAFTAVITADAMKSLAKAKAAARA